MIARFLDILHWLKKTREMRESENERITMRGKSAGGDALPFSQTSKQRGGCLEKWKWLESSREWEPKQFSGKGREKQCFYGLTSYYFTNFSNDFVHPLGEGNGRVYPSQER